MSFGKLKSNAVSAAVLKISGVIFAMMVNIFVARLLEIDEVGYYFLISSLAFFGALLARFGMRQSIVKTIAKNIALNKSATARGAARKFLLITITGTFATCLGYLLLRDWIEAALFESDSYPFVYFVMAWLSILALQSVLSDIFRGYQNIATSTLIDGTLSNLIIAFVLFGLWAAAVSVGITQVVTITLAGYLTVVVFGVARLLKTLSVSVRGQDESSYKDILNLSWPIFIVNLSTYFMGEASIWFVAYFDTSMQVAIYGACVKLVKLVTLPLLIQNIVITPLIVALHTVKDTQKLHQLVRGAATLTAIPSIALIAMYALVGNSVLDILFGADYASGWSVLSVLCVGYLVNVWSGPCNNTLMMTGHERLVMRLFVFSTLIGVGLMFSLGKEFGAVGVAAAVSAGLTIHNALAVIYAYRTEGIKTYATLNPTGLLKLYREVSKKNPRGN